MLTAFGARDSMRSKSILQTLTKWQGSKRRLYLKCAGVGLASGLVVVAYRLALSHLEDLRAIVYASLRRSPWYFTAGWFLLLAGVGLLLGWMARRVWMIRGSGIPQVKGVLLRQLRMQWLKELLLKFTGGCLAIGAGLSLGREGPSIQLGAQVGAGFSRRASFPLLEERYLVSAGASAGLAAAFNAPLAGVLFALEELHKSFSPVMLTCLMIASISADLVSRNFFGLSPVFDLHVQAVLPLRLYPCLLPLGAACGLLGVLFNLLLLRSQKLYGPLREELRPAAALLAAGALGFLLPEVLGGGHGLVERSALGSFGLPLLTLLIAGKLLFTAASYGTGAPGGIFLPMLVIGALLGRLAAVLFALAGLNPQFTVNFVILGMTAFFTAVVRAPITGAILISEMTGTLSHLLALIAVSAVAYAVAELMRSPPIYDALLLRMLKAQGLSPPPGDADKKVILTIPVRLGSSLEHKELRELELPEDCFLVGILRGAQELLPRPRLEILPGDSLAVLTSEDRASQVKPVLLAMGAPAEAETARTGSSFS